MSVKQDVLAIFEASRGRALSGEDLAARLHVSRNAVWKAVQTLRAEGYSITAVPNLGYCFSEETDILSAQSIARHLPAGHPFHFDVRREADSTNLIAKRSGAQGAAEGTVIIAEQQTAGRGRLGRSFVSPYGTGIYMSLLLRPQMPASDSLWLTTAAAVAVAEAIEEISGHEAQIKWVNDVFVHEKKVCGILTEAAMDVESGMLEYAVVGIGVNVRNPEFGFPEELAGIAGAVFAPGEGEADARSRLIATILSRFWKLYTAFPARDFHAEYCRRSLVVGRDVLVVKLSGSSPAHVLAIDEECRLLVEYSDGTQEALATGEISIRPV